MWMFRDSLAVMSVVCMSLSLVEVFSVCHKAVVYLARGFLVPSMSSEHPRTGTSIFTILFTGKHIKHKLFLIIIINYLNVCCTSAEVPEEVLLTMEMHGKWFILSLNCRQRMKFHTQIILHNVRKVTFESN